MMPTPRHQSRNSEIVVSSSKSTNSLYNNNSNNSNKNRRSFVGLHTLKEEMTVDSLQDMINTLKTLPPIISQQPQQQKLDRSPSDENISYSSREAALAEAEAKLMGTFHRRGSSSEENYIKRRTSLQQLPVLNENGESFLDNGGDHTINKRTSMNAKSLSLSLNGGGGNGNNLDNRKQMNRRSSRNFDEWRNSKY
jgi:protein SSD1